MVLARPPARVSSSMAGNGLLYVASRSSRNAASRSPSQPWAASAAPTVRRTYGHRQRRRVERQPVREVGGAVRAAGDLVPHPVELVALDDRGVAGVEPVRGVRVGVPVVRQPHPFVGQPAEGAAAGDDVLPQLSRRSGVRVPACHADDGDLGHAATASSFVSGAPVPAGTAVATVAPGCWVPTCPFRLRCQCSAHRNPPRTAQTSAVPKKIPYAMWAAVRAP